MVRWGALDNTAAVLLFRVRVKVKGRRVRVRVIVFRVRVRATRIMFGMKMVATRRIFDLLLGVNIWRTQLCSGNPSP